VHILLIRTGFSRQTKGFPSKDATMNPTFPAVKPLFVLDDFKPDDFKTLITYIIYV